MRGNVAWWLSKRASQLGQNLIDDSILFKGFLQGQFSATVGGFCVFDSLSEIELHLVKLAVRLHVTYLSKASSVLLVFSAKSMLRFIFEFRKN
jgi:hypothetical protein